MCSSRYSQWPNTLNKLVVLKAGRVVMILTGILVRCVVSKTTIIYSNTIDAFLMHKCHCSNSKLNNKKARATVLITAIFKIYIFTCHPPHPLLSSSSSWTNIIPTAPTLVPRMAPRISSWLAMAVRVPWCTGLCVLPGVCIPRLPLTHCRTSHAAVDVAGIQNILQGNSRPFYNCHMFSGLTLDGAWHWVHAPLQNIWLLAHHHRV